MFSFIGISSFSVFCRYMERLYIEWCECYNCGLSGVRLDIMCGQSIPEGCEIKNCGLSEISSYIVCWLLCCILHRGRLPVWLYLIHFLYWAGPINLPSLKLDGAIVESAGSDIEDGYIVTTVQGVILKYGCWTHMQNDKAFLLVCIYYFVTFALLQSLFGSTLAGCARKNSGICDNPFGLFDFVLSPHMHSMRPLNRFMLTDCNQILFSLGFLLWVFLWYFGDTF